MYNKAESSYRCNPIHKDENTVYDSLHDLSEYKIIYEGKTFIGNTSISIQ